jgi:RNase P/RNase MRP subunit p29
LLCLLQGCSGGSSDSAENTVVNSPTPPQDGIRGRVASKLQNALLTVTDANGEEVVVASGNRTNENGAYDLIFSEFEIEAGITPPLIVTVDGSGATAVCDHDGETDNDCLTANGSFAAFGTRYEVPAGFRLRGLAPTFPPEETFGDRTVTVNLSAASDLAARYATDAAAGAALTEELVSLAQQQALGVVEFVTGLPVGNTAMNAIGLADLTNAAETPSSTSLAVSLFNASLHGQVNTEDAGIANYRLVLNRMSNRIQPGGTTGLLQASSADLATAIASYLVTAGGYQATLTAPLPILNGAVSAQTVTQSRLAEAGTAPVPIALPADPGSDAPLDRSKVFASRLSEVIGASLLNSQTTAFGGTATGSATVNSDQVVLINVLLASEVRGAITQLDAAIANAVERGATELTGTNVSGLIAIDGANVQLTSGTSTVSNIQTGTSVNLTSPEGTRADIGQDGSFTLAGVTIALSQTQNNLTIQVLLEGDLTVELSDLGDGLVVTGSSFSGALQSVSGLAFNGSIDLTAAAGTSLSLTNGSFEASFEFQNGATLLLQGDQAGGIASSTSTSGGSTIFVDHTTNTITDMTTELNLTLDSGDTVTGGTLTSSDVETGSVDSLGVISFSDGTVRALPAPLL